jgi:hypothetical protein
MWRKTAGKRVLALGGGVKAGPGRHEGGAQTRSEVWRTAVWPWRAYGRCRHGRALHASCGLPLLLLHGPRAL